MPVPGSTSRSLLGDCCSCCAAGLNAKRGSAEAPAKKAPAKKARTTPAAADKKAVEPENVPMPAQPAQPVSKKPSTKRPTGGKAAPGAEAVVAEPSAIKSKPAKKARKAASQQEPPPASSAPAQEAEEDVPSEGAQPSGKRRAAADRVTTYKEQTSRAKPSDYVVVKSEAEVVDEATALAETGGNSVGVRRRCVCLHACLHAARISGLIRDCRGSLPLVLPVWPCICFYPLSLCKFAAAHTCRLTDFALVDEANQPVPVERALLLATEVSLTGKPARGDAWGAWGLTEPVHEGAGGVLACIALELQLDRLSNVQQPLVSLHLQPVCSTVWSKFMCQTLLCHLSACPRRGASH